MTLYILDTNIVSDMMRNPAGKVAGHIASVGGDNLCLSIITASELRYGAAKSGSARLLAWVEAVLARVPILPLGIPADTEYGRIRAELETAGCPIGPNDLLIAAHAYSLSAAVVTANAVDFQHIRGLKVENWTVQRLGELESPSGIARVAPPGVSITGSIDKGGR